MRKLTEDMHVLRGAGLLTATVSSEFFRAAQPALLYLVPFTLLPLFIMAYLKVSINKVLRSLCSNVHRAGNYCL